MGTVFQVPWAQIGTCPADWPENGSAQLHALGFKTAAMALSDRSVSIDDPALAAEPKLAIVLGTEGDGLANSTIAACDYTVKIPMSHGVDSLNVAAAQRRQSFLNVTANRLLVKGGAIQCYQIRKCLHQSFFVHPISPFPTNVL